MSALSYEERVQATAVYRLAKLLREAGVLSDYAAAEFNYPGEHQLSEAERNLPI